MKKKSIKYLIWGYYGSGNLGDQLMLSIISRKIRAVRPDALIYAKCARDPKIRDVLPVMLKPHGFKNSPFFRLTYFYKLLSTILKVDKLVIGGGTLFLDRGNHNPSMMALCAAVFLSRIFFKKIYVIGIGVEKLSHPLNILYLKFILNNSYFISVRDKLSFEFVGNFSRRLTVKRTADIVFDKEFTEQILTPPTQEEKYIILAMYDYDRMWQTKEKNGLFFQRSQKLLLDILELWGGEYKIVLCALQKGEGGYDYEFLSELYKHTIKIHPIFSDKINIEYLDSEIKIREYIGHARLAISNRYHALLLCAIFGVPFLGLEVEKKISEICKEFNMPFIEEKKYFNFGIDKSALNSLAGMTIKPESVSRNIQLSKINFEWIN